MARSAWWYASCIALPASPSNRPSTSTAKCFTAFASFQTEVPGSRCNLIPLIFSTFISTDANAAESSSPLPFCAHSAMARTKRGSNSSTTSKTRKKKKKKTKKKKDKKRLAQKRARGEKKLATKVLTADVRDGEVTVARAFEPLTLATVRQIMALKIHEVKVIDISGDDTIVKALRKDPAHDQDEALKDIYRRLRPGDPPTVANARALLKRLFFDPKKYDLGRVGRYKINQKLGINVDPTERILTDKDFIAAIKYLINLRRGEGTLDDIDHLGSRRVRTVGELLANQCRVGLARTERLVKERMTLFDIN